MTWLLLASFAQLILGTSAIADKIFLKQKGFAAWPYTFWLGIFELFALLLIPFGFSIPPFPVIFLAFAAGALFIAGIYFLFVALEHGEASETLPIIGGLSPLFALLFSNLILDSPLGPGDFFGFWFLVLGGLILFYIEKPELRRTTVFATLASAALLGLFGVFAKMVFNETSFITGFILIKLGGASIVVLGLLVRSLRTRIFEVSATPTNYALYIANRGYAAVGSFLFHGALFLAHPALVEATQSFRYIIIFIFGWLILKERFYGNILFGKIVATLFIIGGLGVLAFGDYASRIPVDPARRISWGITFSDKFSRELGLDWQKNFQAILDDLHPQKLRLIAYWDDIEQESGVFDFSSVDWQLQHAHRAGAEVILAVGMKVPRWPECHVPAWALRLTAEDREQALHIYMQKVIARYRFHTEIILWQVENEPYLLFGECPMRGKQFLEKEIALVKSLDPARPVLITDGGEFGLWYKAARLGDRFGTTMYRSVYPKFIGPVFGTIEYPITPSYFRLKEKFVRWMIQDPEKQFFVIELQAEPWGSELLPTLSYETQRMLFPPEYFEETIHYAKETGFDDYYLWGAEWWYWLKEKQDDSAIWEKARTLFR